MAFHSLGGKYSGKWDQSLKDVIFSRSMLMAFHSLAGESSGRWAQSSKGVIFSWSMLMAFHSLDGLSSGVGHTLLTFDGNGFPFLDGESSGCLA